MKIPINPKPCPQCKRTMRGHCRDKYCGWLFCGVCAITMDKRTGRFLRKTYGEEVK